LNRVIACLPACEVLSFVQLLFLAGAAVVGSAAQSATGFGVALPISPVAFALLRPADAVLVVASSSLINNLLILATRRRALRLRRGDATLLVVAALPGLAVGALIVGSLPKPPMQLAVGVAILAAVGFGLHEAGRQPALAGRSVGVAVGALAGLLTTTVGINGPPLVIWLRARRATLAELRDTLAAVFLILNVIAFAGVTSRGGAIPAAAIPALLVGLLAGHVLGLRAHASLPERTLDRALVTILAAAALASIVGGAAALL